MQMISIYYKCNNNNNTWLNVMRLCNSEIRQFGGAMHYGGVIRINISCVWCHFTRWKNAEIMYPWSLTRLVLILKDIYYYAMIDNIEAHDSKKTAPSQSLIDDHNR